MSGSVVVPVIAPLQLSVAVGGAVIVAEHWPVASGKLPAFGTGAVVSVHHDVLRLAVVVLPLPSLNVQ